MATERKIEWGAGLKPGELQEFVAACGRHRAKFDSSAQPSRYKVQVELAGYQESIFDEPQPVLKLTNPKTAVNTLCLLSEAEAVGIRRTWVEYHLIWTEEQRQAHADKMHREFEERQLREWKQDGHRHPCTVSPCYESLQPRCYDDCAAGPGDPLEPRVCDYHRENGYQLDLLKLERHV